MLNNKIFIFIESNFNKFWFKIIYNLFLPIFQWIEISFFKKIWVNDILERFAENDNFVDFLNKNEFAIINDKFLLKQDTISNEYYKLPKQELEILIKKEFVTAFVEIIKLEFVSDYENMLTIIVNTDISKEKILTYSIEVNYYRQHIIKQNFKNIWFKWLPLFLILVFSSYLLISKFL